MDNYAQLGVREYARNAGVSPPTASRILKGYAEEGLLTREEDRRYHLYRANRTAELFIDIQKAFMRQLLEPLASFLEEETQAETIVLFGSATKGSFTNGSDLDLFVDSSEQPIDLKRFTEDIGRNPEIHFRDSLKNRHLAKSIEEGLYLRGNRGLEKLHAEQASKTSP